MSINKRQPFNSALKVICNAYLLRQMWIKFFDLIGSQLSLLSLQNFNTVFLHLKTKENNKFIAKSSQSTHISNMPIPKIYKFLVNIGWVTAFP